MVVELDDSPFPAEFSVIALVEARGLSRLYQVTRDLASVRLFDIGADGGLTGSGQSVAVTGGRQPNGAAYRDGGEAPASRFRRWEPGACSS